MGSIHDSIDRAMSAAKDGRTRTDAKRIVVVHVGPDRIPVKATDPVTWKPTSDSQQFVLEDDGRMAILPRYDWIENPEVIEVPRWSIG